MTATAQYVPLGRRCSAVLYAPAAGRNRASTGVLVCHPSASSLNHVTTRELQRRGITVLAVDTPYSNVRNHAQIWEELPQYVALGITHLKSSVEHVALLGHSMAGPLMAYYQNCAEHEGAARLPAADAVVLVD